MKKLIVLLALASTIVRRTQFRGSAAQIFASCHPERQQGTWACGR